MARRWTSRSSATPSTWRAGSRRVAKEKGFQIVMSSEVAELCRLPGRPGPGADRQRARRRRADGGRGHHARPRPAGQHPRRRRGGGAEDDGAAPQGAGDGLRIRDVMLAQVGIHANCRPTSRRLAWVPAIAPKARLRHDVRMTLPAWRHSVGGYAHVSRRPAICARPGLHRSWRPRGRRR